VVPLTVTDPVDGILNDHFIANFLLSVSLKVFLKFYIW